LEILLVAWLPARVTHRRGSFEPVIGDVHERASAVLDRDGDAFGFGVERVLDQLLHDRGSARPLRCGDLVGDLFGKEMNRFTAGL